MLQTNSGSTAVRSINSFRSVKAASGLALLAGAWLFVSPWVYGAYTNPTAWNSWIVGALIFLFGIVRVSRPAVSLFSWFNMILGIWTFCSPWIFGYSDHTGRFINSLCVGFVVFVLSIASARFSSSTLSPTQNI
jgi:site-specific recombinase